jgi:hypothetical protein
VTLVEKMSVSVHLAAINQTILATAQVFGYPNHHSTTSARVVHPRALHGHCFLANVSYFQSGEKSVVGEDAMTLQLDYKWEETTEVNNGLVAGTV